MENYVALDLETTGLSPKNDRILEIGAVKIEEGRETGRIATLIDPQNSPKLVNRKILPNELNILLVVLKVSFRKDNDFRDNILDCC